MPSSWRYKILSVAVLIGFAIVVMVPTVFAPTIDKDDPGYISCRDDGGTERDCASLQWPGWYSWFRETLYDQTLTPGLDLQGGLHLQYQVDVDKAIEQRTENAADDIERNLTSDGVGVSVEMIDGTSFRVTLDSADDAEALDEILSLYQYLDQHSESSTTFRLEWDEDELADTRQSLVETAISTIRSRVDGLGVAEPSITTRGESDIIVQLPGLGEDEFEEAKRLIGTTAQLEFRGLHPGNSTFWRSVRAEIPDNSLLEYRERGGTIEAIGSAGLEELRRFASSLQPVGNANPFDLPEDAIIAFDEQLVFSLQGGQRDDDQTIYTARLLNSVLEMTGENISDSRPSQDPTTNKPFVSLTFDSEGARTFCDVSTAYTGQPLAIVLDDIIKSAPVIEGPICAGRARINMGTTGSFEGLYREVEALVIVLEHGALPAPIEPQFETQVGPTLGADSVRSGQKAMIIGSVFVILFMVVYYRVSGVFANFALALNVLFILALLTAVGATVTLPGIAGIILTVGMAVDANVIVFERIREELRIGKTPRDAVHAGYAKALWTVLDANITTGIAALVLASYGSGPIKGFAITLLFGIVSSVFTALVITRLLFDWYTTKSKTQRLSI